MYQSLNLSRRALLLSGVGATAALATSRVLVAQDTRPLRDDVRPSNDTYLANVCYGRILPPELRAGTLQLAWKEDRLNDAARKLDENGNPKPNPQPAAAALDGRKWKQNRQLRVGFVTGTSQRLRSKVQRHAEKWHDVVNIRFLFGTPGPHEIRISFNRSAPSSSYIGTDNLSVPSNLPTMNFLDVTETSDDINDQAVILHEFGHALFMIHEHQSPAGAGTIEWNETAVINDMSQYGWSAEDCRHNIFNRYTRDQTQFTELDKTSIMMYSYPRHWTTTGFAAPRNAELSAQDKKFMNEQYPTAGPVQPTDPDPEPTPAECQKKFVNDADGRRAKALKRIRKVLNNVQADISE